MKKIITLLMALLLCACATGCAELEYIFGPNKKPEVQVLPTIYERKIVAEAKIEEDYAGFYKATLNGMMKFDFYPNNITLLCNGYTSAVEPESIVYANVVSNNNTYSFWYVATFNYATFNFEEMQAGTFPLVVYAEDDKGTMYVVQTTLTLTSPKELTGNVIYDEKTNTEFKLFNDIGLKDDSIYYNATRCELVGSVNVAGWPVEIENRITTHAEGEKIVLQQPKCFGYIFKGWQNVYTGTTYYINENGTCEITFPGGAFILGAIWEIDTNIAVGPEIEI